MRRLLALLLLIVVLGQGYLAFAQESTLTLAELKTEISVHKDYKDLTDEQWIAKSALRGLTHRSQVDFDWWEGFYPKKISEIRKQLAGVITVPIVAGMTKQEYSEQVAEYTTYLEAKEIRLLDKLAAVIEEQRLRKDEVVVRTGIHDATPIYIDYDNGADINDGETIGNSIKNILTYTVTQARVPGDIGFLRAGITWDQGTEAADIGIDESGDLDEYISLIGCDSVTNDPWSDADDTLPIIDFEDANFNMYLVADDYWKFERIDIRQSGDTSGAIYSLICSGLLFESCTIRDGASNLVDGISIAQGSCVIDTCTFQDCDGPAFAAGQADVYIKDCVIDAGAGVGSTYGIYALQGTQIDVENTTIAGNNAFDTAAVHAAGFPCIVRMRNVTFGTETLSVTDYGRILSEDHDGTFEDQYSLFAGATSADTGKIERDTGTVRGGGADSSAKMTPDTGCGLIDPLILGDRMRGFARIWATKDVQIDIDIYVAVGTAWDVALTSTTCYAKFSYLNHAVNATRTVITSNDTITNDTNFTTALDTGNFTPLGTGWVYMWVYVAAYDADEHIFVDIKPVVN